MHRPIKRALLPLLALLALTMASPAQNGQVRTVNLSPDALPMDVYVSDTLAPVAPNLFFPSASLVSEHPAGVTRIQVTMAGMRAQMYIDADFNIVADQRINVLIMNRLNAIEGVTLSFNPALQPHADSAYLRLLNASPNGGAVDFEVKGANGVIKKFNNVPFKSSTNFFTVPAGLVDVKVFAAGTTTVLFRGGKTVPGSMYGTVIIDGLVPQVQLHLLNETLTNPQIPLDVFEPISAVAKLKIRAVQGVSDAPPVDIFIDSTAIIQNLQFRDASAMVDLDSGNYRLGVGPTGQPVGSTVVSTNLSFKPDSTYTVVSLGRIATATLGLQVLARPLTLSVSGDSILVRILHASADAGSVDITVIDAAGGTTNLPSIPFQGTTGYQKLPAGRVQVDVSPSGMPQFYSADDTIPSGSIVTLIATGNVADTTFTVNVLYDNDNTEQKPMDELTPIVLPTGQAALRLVHCSPDAGAIDIFIANEANDPVELSFRDAGLGLEGPAGLTNFKVAPHGAGIGSAVLNTDHELFDQTLTTLFAVGSLAQLNLGVESLVSTRADSAQTGNALLRILQASPDAGSFDIELTKADNTKQLFSGVAFRSNIAYMQIPAGKVSFKIFPAGSSTPTIAVSGTIPERSIATAILTGSTTGGNLGVNVLFDDTQAAQKPMMLLTADVTSVDHFDVAASGMTVAPNPVVGMATIEYRIDKATDVRIDLYDSRGQVAATLAPGHREAGNHQARFGTAMLPAGTYTAVLRGATGTLAQTTVVVVH